jgi:peptidoglycan/LPS O-acetylase OafA/YrhL
VGAYFGKYEIKIKKHLLILGYALIPSLIFFYCVLSSQESVLKYIEYSYLSVVLQGMLLFLFFIKLELKSKIINYLGSLVYGGYIIHVLFISILQKVFPFTTFFNSNYYPIIDLLFIFFVLVASFLMEIIRFHLFRFLEPKFVTSIGIIRHKINKFEKAKAYFVFNRKI